MSNLIPVERIGNRIMVVRGHRVMMDADLAEIYGVPTKVLNQAVKRNKDRFPPRLPLSIDERGKGRGGHKL